MLEPDLTAVLLLTVELEEALRNEVEGGPRK